MNTDEMLEGIARDRDLTLLEAGRNAADILAIVKEA